MEFYIKKADPTDLEIIFQLFEEAINFQKQNNYIGWKEYDQTFLSNEVNNGFLYKIIVDDAIACIFSICYADPFIWREMEQGNALYLHRIVLNRKFAGKRLFEKVLEWSIYHAHTENLQYIRMDTWAENEKIIDYYKSYGFRYIETYTTGNNIELPIQHRNLNITLLEFSLIT